MLVLFSADCRRRYFPNNLESSGFTYAAGSMVFDNLQAVSPSQTRRSHYYYGSDQPRTQLPRDESLRTTSYQESLLLAIIGVIRHQKIPQSFIITPREPVKLGSGISFAVEEPPLSQPSTILQRPYRCRNVTNALQTEVFTDLRGMAWAENSRVAHKKGSKPIHLGDTFKKLRVLCHGPLVEHPNIVRLPGVAWSVDQDAEESNSAQDPDSGKPLECPILLTERAPHGSLDQFLRSST